MTGDPSLADFWPGVDATGFFDVVPLEPTEPAFGRLGPEQSWESLKAADARGHHSRGLSGPHPDDEVVDVGLRLLVTLTRATVTGADGVSVSLRRHGSLSTVASSNGAITGLDADQYATGQGPCIDASAQGRWFHVESLDTETRWPAFASIGRELGVQSILSSPLWARGEPVGSLNIYSRTAATFAPKDQELAEEYAAEASSLLS
ncbi:MAG: GAF domain-containing protein, partial [Acidimicrobiales bacterium]